MTCTACGRPTRKTGMPAGYFGPVVSQVLYYYCKLLEPDTRYLSSRLERGRVWMCDVCKLAGAITERRGDPASPGAGCGRPQ
jgi:hypothetical protein